MQIEFYNPSFESIWDNFVENSLNGTFLHTRRYLSYHRERFEDVSVLLKDENNKLVGLFPAAVDPNSKQRVVSHPGITYGGILHTGKLRGALMVRAIAELKNYYAERNFEALRYKVVPNIYHRFPAADDLYALFVHDAIRYRCDLSCAIDLRNRLEPSSRRRRSLKKALKFGITADESPRFAKDLWSVLEENLANKYKARPVHSIAEIMRLQSLFPEQIKFVAGLLEKRVVAGVVLFLTEVVAHVQYIASSQLGYETSALDEVFKHCIEAAINDGKQWFDFGTSNEDNGRKLNESLYNFKSEFGGGGVVHEFYEMSLR